MTKTDAQKKILTAVNTGMNKRLLEIEIGHILNDLLRDTAEKAYEKGYKENRTRRIPYDSIAKAACRMLFNSYWNKVTSPNSRDKK